MEGHGVVGFRFHPTEEEIITYFLESKMRGIDFPAHTIADVGDVCKYEPWELPQRSRMPQEDRVWYFFNAPVPKYANSKLINRTTKSGFWKPTGKDRIIWDEQGKKIGFKKNLVFHTGRVPNGIRTNWVVHEYHSHNASSYSKEFVLFRLKKKSADKPDACNEPTPQINRNLSEELPLILIDAELDYNFLAEVLSNNEPAQGTSIDSSGFDHNTLPALPSMVQPINSNGFDHTSLSSLLPEHGTSYSNGFNNEPSFLNDCCPETSEQEDTFGYGIMDFDILSVDSDTDLPWIVGHESVVDELQHATKYHKYFEAQCSTQKLQTQRKVPNKAVLKVEMGEAVHHAVDLPRTEKATVRSVKGKKLAQKTRARKDSHSSSNGSTSSSKKKLYISNLTAASDGAGSSNKRRSFISLEIPQLSHKKDPPSVYLLNVLVSLVLVIFIIREMAYLH